MRWPRILLPPKPFVPPAIPEGMAWCTTCRGAHSFGVIDGDPEHGIPPFAICCRCGGSLDLEEESA